MTRLRIALAVFALSSLAVAGVAVAKSDSHIYSSFKPGLRVRIFTEGREVTLLKFNFDDRCRIDGEIKKASGGGERDAGLHIQFGKRGRFGYATSFGLGTNFGVKGVVRRHAITGRFRSTEREGFDTQCWTGKSPQNAWVPFRAVLRH